MHDSPAVFSRMKNIARAHVAVMALALVLSAGAQTQIVELTGKDLPVLKGLESYHCYKSKTAFVLSKDPDRAARITAEIERAAKEFKLRFGVDAKTAVVPEVPIGFKIDKDVLVKLGVTVALPLPEPGSTTPEQLKSVEEHYDEYFKQKYPELTATQRADSVKKAVERFKKTEDDLGISVVAHEIGHQWYGEAFWKSVSQPAVNGEVYGSPADDYLDECAAIMMEPTPVARWNDLRRSYADPAQKALFHPLKELVTMKHPHNTAEPAAANLMFYSQCRALIDYLHEKTKNEHIFAEITEANVRGEGFEAWLRSAGAKYSLPTDIAEFEVQWKKWIDEKLAAK